MQNTNIDNLINSAFNAITVKDESNAANVIELLDKYGLAWQVETQSLQLPTGKASGFFGIVRTDTKNTFATCKEGYSPYQNSELAELVLRLAEKTGYSIHSGGSFNCGGKVYLQLNTGTEIKGIGENNDIVKGFATGINGHDGSSLRWGSSNITISCKNTYVAASKQLKNTARHTVNMRSKIEESLREISGIVKQEQALFDKFITLAEVPAKKEHIVKIVKQITEVDITLNKTELRDKNSTYSVNRAEELLQSIAKESKQKGNTLWGLFSGVTHYTSHVMPAPTRTNGRLESKYIGSGLATDNEAFATVLGMAGIN